MMHMIK